MAALFCLNTFIAGAGSSSIEVEPAGNEDVRASHPSVFDEFKDVGDGAMGGTRMLLIDTEIGQYNDWCKGWKLELLTGDNAGEEREIVGYYAMLGQVAVKQPFTHNIKEGDQYRIYLTEYDMKNIYYLCCQKMTEDIHYLDLTPQISNGDSTEITDGDINKENLNTSIGKGRMNFSYPRPGMAAKGAGLYCEFDATAVTFCNLSVNTLGAVGKQISVEIWYDTDGDYNIVVDGDDRTKIEGIMDVDFNEGLNGVQPYTTVGASVMMEEFADGIGVWRQMPAANELDMESGQIFVVVNREDGMGDPWPAADFILYCGYTAKLSWISLPYEHPLVSPVAVGGVKAKLDEGPYGLTAGFNDTKGQMVIKEGEEVLFCAYDSYDPQDDNGMDGLAFGDPGWTGKDTDFEGNDNIDDGVPEGEVDIGEVSNLMYKWDWGYGRQSTGWLNTPYATHIFRIPAGYEYMIFNVKLTVRDPDMHMDTMSLYVLVWADPGVPPVVSMNILPDADETDNEVYVLTGQEFEVSGYATDPDAGQVLSYFWDLDNDDVEYVPGDHIDFEGALDKNGTTVFRMSYDEPGDHRITLNVYDGPVNDTENTLNATDYMIVHVVDNVPPEGIVSARPLGTSMKLAEDEIQVKVGQDIEFTLEALDPDNLPGFDEDGDMVVDSQLQYKWDFGDGKTSDWTISSVMSHNYTGKGSPDVEYMYYPVTVQIRDGSPLDSNTAVVTTQVFRVYVNMQPFAEAGPNLPNINYITQEIQAGDMVYFTGAGSYDPNDDVDNSAMIDGDEVDTLYYRWDFGDGSELAEGKEPTHVFDQMGNYVVTLTVFDTGGLSATDSTLVRVRDSNGIPLPVVTLNVKEGSDDIPDDPDADPNTITVYTFEDIVFDATNSYDPDGDAYTDDLNSTASYEDLTFMWDFGLEDETTTSAAYTVFSYNEDGTYLVTLTITDSSHERTVSVTSEYEVTVLNRNPEAVVDGPEDALIGDDLIFSSEGSSDKDGTVVEYSWDWGDEEKTPWSSEPRANHVYTKSNVYKVKLWVKDNDGATSLAAEMNVTVEPDIEDPDNRPIPIDSETATFGIIALIVLIAIIIGAIGLFLYISKVRS